MVLELRILMFSCSNNLYEKLLSIISQFNNNDLFLISYPNKNN